MGKKAYLYRKISSTVGNPKPYDKHFVSRYAILGVVLGVLFIALVVLIQVLVESESFSLKFLVRMYKLYPAMYLVDTVPIFMGVGMALFARSLSRYRVAATSCAADRERHAAELSAFVQSMRSNSASAYAPDESDELGCSLVALRDELAEQRVIELQRKEEEEQRRWIAEGIAQFGDILRSEKSRLEDLAYEIVSNLVKYLDAKQCGFYMVDGEEDGDRHFQLMACYAYDRRKFANQRLEWGDGLVGACALEGVTTRLDHVPDGYLRITSGLGEATPQNLMLVPVKLDEQVFGVLEMASFKAFTARDVEFCEKVASSIASSLLSKRISVRTAQLLLEREEKAAQLEEKEKEMSSNLEELRATQEEAASQAEQFISFTNSVNHTLIHAEYSVEGILQTANAKFLQKLEYNDIREVEGKHISLFINRKDREWFDSLWAGVASGGRHFEGDLKHVTRSGKDLWTIATYSCIQNQHGVVERVLFLAIDTTHDKILNLDWQGQVEALNRVSLKAELTPLGDVVLANDKFFETLGYMPADILKKPVYQLFPANEQAQFEYTLSQVCKGEPFEGTLKVIMRDGSEGWLRVSLATVTDMYGDIAKVILIANDITREKLIEMESRHQTEQLKLKEEQLRQNEVDLSRKLREATEEVSKQLHEVKKVQERYEKTYEGFLDAIITTDQDGTVEFFNRAAEDMFGISRKDILGQQVGKLFPDDIVEQNAFIAAYVDPNAEKIVGQRQEVETRDVSGEKLLLYVLVSVAQVGRKSTYTAFIQRQETELELF